VQQTDIDKLLADVRSDHLDYVLTHVSKKPTPYIVKSYDVGKPTDYDADYSWHSLRKEKMFELPYRGRLGVVNPNSDISYYIGFAFDGGPAEFCPPSKTKLHLMDALVEAVEIGGVHADVCFVPVASDTLLAAVVLTNAGPKTSFTVCQVCSKEPSENDPKQRYGYGLTVTAGRALSMVYDAPSDAMRGVFTEWPPGTDGAAGKLVCTMAGAEKSSSQNAVGGLRMDYEVSLAKDESRTLLFAVNLHRYADKPVKSPWDMTIYPVETDDAAAHYGLRLTREAIATDMLGLLRKSVARYDAMPDVRFPQESWIADYYAALELPWAETYSPQKKIRTPFYNFTRAHGNEPYDWWSYGMHGHENLSTFTLDITQPGLSADFLRGHFAFQLRNGMYPYGVNQNGGWREHIATCPLIAWESWNAYLWSGDKKFLAEAYASCKKNHGYWQTRHRGRSTLSNWLDWLENVRDDPDLPTWSITDGAENQEALDINCYLVMEDRSLAEMAHELGQDKEAEQFEASASLRAKEINDQLWHSEDGCYYGRDTLTGKWARVHDISTFFPIWAEIADKQRAECILKLLDDPKSFGTDYPIPTLAVHESQFGAQWHWHGSNWVEMTWLPLLGLKSQGRHDQAADLAYRNAKMVFDVLKTQSHFREYYNSIDGSPVDLIDYIWTCMPAAMLTRAVFGVDPTREGLVVMPALPRGWHEASIDRLRVRDKLVGVSIREADKASVTLNGKPLTLRENRGCFVRWAELPAVAHFDITFPARR